MPIGWFLAPYQTHVRGPDYRYCGMDDFTPLIRADGGDWREVEILDQNMGRCIVKVRASATTLSTIAGTFTRIPLGLLNDSLGSLTTAQRNAIRNEVRACGYSLAEIDAAFPDLSTKTLGDVLRFLASRRRYARFTGTVIVCDGALTSCESVDRLDQEIQP